MHTSYPFYLTAAGPQPDEAISVARRALELEPGIRRPTAIVLAVQLALARRFDEAMAESTKDDRSGSRPWALHMTSSEETFVWKGCTAKPCPSSKRKSALSPDNAMSRWRILAYVHAPV